MVVMPSEDCIYKDLTFSSSHGDNRMVRFSKTSEL